MGGTYRALAHLRPSVSTNTCSELDHSSTKYSVKLLSIILCFHEAFPAMQYLTRYVPRKVFLSRVLKNNAQPFSNTDYACTVRIGRQLDMLASPCSWVANWTPRAFRIIQSHGSHSIRHDTSHSRYEVLGRLSTSFCTTLNTCSAPTCGHARV